MRNITTIILNPTSQNGKWKSGRREGSRSKAVNRKFRRHLKRVAADVTEQNDGPDGTGYAEIAEPLEYAVERESGRSCAASGATAETTRNAIERLGRKV